MTPHGVAIALGLLLAFCAGCGQRNLEEIQVASIHSFSVDSLGHVGVVGTITSGEGRIAFVDTSGKGWRCEVNLQGPGIGVDIGGYALADDPFGLFESSTMRLPSGKTLSADKLMGVYSGEHGGVQLGLGIASHELTNPSGVTIKITNSAVGAGINASLEWLSLSDCDPESTSLGSDGGP
ncbi:MAG: hypothetical protein AB2A00_23245 [Myxococcota bacterium]